MINERQERIDALEAIAEKREFTVEEANEYISLKWFTDEPTSIITNEKGQLVINGKIMGEQQ